MYASKSFHELYLVVQEFLYRFLTTVPSKVLKIVAGMLTVCDTSYHGMRQAPASKFKVEKITG